MQETAWWQDATDINGNPDIPCDSFAPEDDEQGVAVCSHCQYHKLDHELPNKEGKMETTTKSLPVETDTKLAELYRERNDIRAKLTSVVEFIARNEGKAWEQTRIERYRIDADRYRDELLAIDQQAKPLEGLYIQHRWTRYYLVDNANGHVHSSTSCSTCYPTTQYYWCVEQSGLTAEELVELAGEEACTVCFPDAPVATLNRPSLLSTPEREELARKRAEREARSAELAQKREANSLTNPDGSPIRIDTGSLYPERVDTVSAGWRELMNNTMRIRNWNYDPKVYNQAVLPGYQKMVEVVTEALKHKLGEQAFTEAFDKKLKARIKRGW